MPVARLDIPVLIGAAKPNRLGHQAVMRTQGRKLRIEIPLRTRANAVRRRTAVIHPQIPGNRAQLVQPRLQALPQRQQRLRLATRGPFPIGIRQHRMTKQVLVNPAGNRHPQFTGMGPIQLQRHAGLPVLREKHLLVRPFLQPP